ncbi:terminal uridylyltransferase 4 isoform X2 [Hyperolius riggenbachi]|uniref:terminal uridylyltransferase 4 isoform X2 n=1 Tax=Hyperolius riggenbachi TaxID=752182 RepID=UPI0035A33E80
MDGNSRPASHESRKPQERRGKTRRHHRGVNSQKHKNRAEAKLGQEGDANSPATVKKAKQPEACNVSPGDSRNCKENPSNCTSGSGAAEQGLQDVGNTRARRSSPLQAGNVKPQQANKPEPSSLQSKDAGDGPENQIPIAQSAENGPETKKGTTCSDVPAEAPSGVEKPPLCKAAESSPSPESVRGDATPTDESTIADQELGLKQAEERLERDYIHRLEKRSPDFSNCQYLCKLCSVHIENVQGAHKHIKEKRHKKNILEKQEENELRALPPPSEAQIAALSAALVNAAKEHGISQEDFLCRQEIVSRMEKTIQVKLPDCSLRMYGSSLTRFAFKTSDINIDVKFPQKMSQPDVLIQVLEILRHSSLFVEVESDFHAKVPVVFCKDKDSGIACKVSAGNDTACLTTELLAAVGRLEHALVPLVLAFRYWARLCHIDCQAEGGIPAYSFALMVVFFLQRRQPPILPTYLGSGEEGFESKRLDDYHLKGVSGEKYLEWEYTPGSNDKNSGADGRGRVEQNHRRAAAADMENKKHKYKSGKCHLVFERPHNLSLGELWLELLRFYTLEFAMEEYVISIRVHGPLTREAKNWPRRRIAIEDPFALKRNVARSLNSQMVYEYILERFRAAYKYFACPQSKDKLNAGDKKKRESLNSSSPGDTGGVPGEDASSNQEGVEEEGSVLRLEGEGSDVSEGPAEPAHRLCAQSEESISAQNLRKTNELPLSETEQTSEPPGAGGSRDCTERDSATDTTEVMCLSEADDSVEESGSDISATSNHQQETLQNEGILHEGEMYYIFNKFILTSGKPPTIVCSICKRDGHSRDDCPEDFKKIDLKPLPPMTPKFRDILDRVCRCCFDELSPNPIEQQNREQILIYLERFIRKEFNGNARLCLFGSSKNGFGFRDSDLDICMTLEGHENAEKLNCKDIIESLAKILKRHPGLRNILPITTAKVPIVKFEHRESGMEGDISLYNTLAQHNTRMLATYAAIDPRVKYLGYAVKFFAKRCDIGDASRGSLSSYAYILMVLYFLQQRNPPVIPVLQEIYDGQVTPQRMVDGWNAFFFDNTEELRIRFPSMGKNKESVGELLLGFLRFYTEEFDFKEYVISIRQKKLLTTFEKQWTSKCIAIEDPFDLNHNLGAGVSRKMTNFIMKAFINGRKLFGTPFYPPLMHEAEYFFDSKVLTDGELAPNDRCCRVCGKIGHYMKDCPKRRRVKKKENEKDDDKDIKDDDRELRDKRCFNCGNMGHVRRECPENNPAHQKNSILASQILNLIVPQQVITPLQQVERVPRTRQASESSESHRSSYSPQPQPFGQNSMSQSQSQQSKLQQQVPTAGNAHQVPRPVYNFPHSPPTHYSPLPLLPLPAQLPMHNNGWPIHGQVIRPSGNPSRTGGVTYPKRPGSSNSPNQGAVNLNDPSIIFAQPARPMGAPTLNHDGYWQKPQTPPSLMTNGNLSGTDPGYQGNFGKTMRPFQRGNRFPVIPRTWSFGFPQQFLQQNPASFHSKAYYPSAPSLIQNGPQFPVLSQGHPNRNPSFVQQKK